MLTSQKAKLFQKIFPQLFLQNLHSLIIYKNITVTGQPLFQTHGECFQKWTSDNQYPLTSALIIAKLLYIKFLKIFWKGKTHIKVNIFGLISLLLELNVNDRVVNKNVSCFQGIIVSNFVFKQLLQKQLRSFCKTRQ